MFVRVHEIDLVPIDELLCDVAIDLVRAEFDHCGVEPLAVVIVLVGMKSANPADDFRGLTLIEWSACWPRIVGGACERLDIAFCEART
jgi:hypothetical protein